MADTKPREMGAVETRYMRDWGKNGAEREAFAEVDDQLTERDTLIGELGRALETVNETVNNIQQTGHADLWDEIGRLNGAVTELREQVAHLLEHHDAEEQPDAPDAPEQPEGRVCGECSDWGETDWARDGWCYEKGQPYQADNKAAEVCYNFAERTDPAPPEPEVAELVETVDWADGYLRQYLPEDEQPTKLWLGRLAAIRERLLRPERPRVELTEGRQKDLKHAILLADGDGWHFVAAGLREILAMCATTDAGEVEDAQS